MPFLPSPLGGLHENVLAPAVAAACAGWGVSVLCLGSRFLEEHLRTLGIEPLAVDQQSASSIEQARSLLCSADVIHAHPGPSLTLALEAATISGAPVVFTIHGALFDSVNLYARRLAAIICASNAVQEAVYRLCPDQLTIIDCIPTGIDAARFAAVSGVVPEWGHVVVASLLDGDKRVFIDTLVGLWEVQARRDARYALRYPIAGQGTLQGELQLAAQQLCVYVHFASWLATDAFARLYWQASAVIASGRGAMEALAVGRPTLALASAGTAEAFELSELPEAARSNFGGYGVRAPQSLEALFDKLCAGAASKGTAFASYAKDFVQAHHDNSVFNQRLFDLYDQVLKINRLASSIESIRPKRVCAASDFTTATMTLALAWCRFLNISKRGKMGF